MKRIVFKLALFLLLGAIINVLVAWGCALWLELDSNNRESGVLVERDSDRRYEMTRWHRAGVEVILSVSDLRSEQFEEDSRKELLPDWVQCDERLNNILLEGRGWPRISMYAQHFPNRFGIATRGKPWHIWGTPMDRMLPMHPAMPGFAINTTFYAAILPGGWLPLAALLGAVRRRRRIKRGLCPKCAYDLRGSDHKLCPECGVNASKPS